MDLEGLLFWFEELGQEHNGLVGKKCANLGEMTKIGLPVPQGFALSVHAYVEFMSSTRAAEEILDYLNTVRHTLNGIDDFSRVSERIRKIVENKTLPDNLKEKVITAYRELCHRCNCTELSVSTRSAGPSSHPGQYETYLNVKGERDVEEKIKKVWSSTFNARSMVARSQHSIPLESDPIGVAVMRMISAKAAGVGFTADPNTGDPSLLIIEANWGLGESVVSGMLTPDNYIVNKDSLKIEERKIAEKTSEIVACGEHGVLEQSVPTDRKYTPVLSDEDLLRLTELGKSLERHFGCAQDFEWVIDITLPPPNNLYVVQSRALKTAQKVKSAAQVIADMMVDRAMLHRMNGKV
jgi:pyruvate, water dikinase